MKSWKSNLIIHDSCSSCTITHLFSFHLWIKINRTVTFQTGTRPDSCQIYYIAVKVAEFLIALKDKQECMRVLTPMLTLWVIWSSMPDAMGNSLQGGSFSDPACYVHISDFYKYRPCGSVIPGTVTCEEDFHWQHRNKKCYKKKIYWPHICICFFI